MHLNEVARTPPIVCSPEASVLEATKLMAANDVGAVIVTDAFGKVAGIFTERDNMLRVTMQDRNPKTTQIKDVMTASVKTASPEMSATEALAKMVRSKYRHLPIVDDGGRVTGVVSVRHLLMKRLAEQSSDIETLNAYATAGGPG